MAQREHVGKVDAKDPLTSAIIGAAIEVHRGLGPGLLESAYEACLEYELRLQGLDVQRQLILPVTYKTLVLDQAYRLDLLVEGRVIIEIKAIDRLIELHEAQLLTYLRLSKLKVGLILNFEVPMMKLGIHRRVL
jgi:GxxExxY protein